jgi:N-carbamoyl-L-amino-acid hydrolase
MVTTRRELIASLASLALIPRRAADGAVAPRVDAARLRARLEGLSRFGRPSGGSFADGVTRVGYSEADVAGRAFAMDAMRRAGLEARIDPAGNIVGRRAGSEPALAPVLFGSHIDSVPSGGNFDGDVGSMAAIEVIETLGDHALETRRPLEVVIWANEEGVAYGNGLCGSRAAAGRLEPGELDQVWNGVRKADAIRRIGGDPDRLEAARRTPGSFHAYLELHIEQGGVLDRAGIPIGVVEGIVAIDRYDAVIRGFANHAGTTPMPERHDALIAASRLVLAVREAVTSEPGRQVGTVGQLSVAPGAPNVIPGEVRHTIELRDLSGERIRRLAETIRARARSIAEETGTEITLTQTSHHDEALATPDIQRRIEAAAERLGLRTMRLPSGAGHDAQMMARRGPMGMIFIPSVSGSSHSPRELSRWEDCARGADVLLHTVLDLAS